MTVYELWRALQFESMQAQVRVDANGLWAGDELILERRAEPAKAEREVSYSVHVRRLNEL